MLILMLKQMRIKTKYHYTNLATTNTLTAVEKKPLILVIWSKELSIAQKLVKLK